MLIVLTPVICATVFAWKDYTNAYELTENILDEEQDSSKKQTDIEKYISYPFFCLLSAPSTPKKFTCLVSVTYKIALKVLTPPPK